MLNESILFYHYPKCSTCKKAMVFLREHGISFEAIDISRAPPPERDLREMISRQGNVRSLFNTSGKSYREGGYATVVKNMSVDDAVKVLAKDGMLIKRPFVLTGRAALLGFDPKAWAQLA